MLIHSKICLEYIKKFPSESPFVILHRPGLRWLLAVGAVGSHLTTNIGMFLSLLALCSSEHQDLRFLSCKNRESLACREQNLLTKITSFVPFFYRSMFKHFISNQKLFRKNLFSLAWDKLALMVMVVVVVVVVRQQSQRSECQFSKLNLNLTRKYFRINKFRFLEKVLSIFIFEDWDLLGRFVFHY